MTIAVKPKFISADMTTDTELASIDQKFDTITDNLLNQSKDSKVIVVKKQNAATGEFTSIKSAIDSITDATSTNPYIVKVGPGVYTEDVITMKSWVSVVGHSDNSTVIQPITNTQTIITGAESSQLTNVTLTGASGISGRAVYHQGTVGAPFVLKNVTFGGNETQVAIHGATATTLCRVENCTMGGGSTSDFTNGFTVTNAGSIATSLVINNFIFQDVTPPYATTLLYASGINVRVSIATSTFRIGTGSSAEGLVVENGADLRVNNSSLRGFDKSVYAKNVGNAPNIVTQGLWISESTTYDLLIEHPTTTGEAFASYQYTKVLIPETSTFFLKGKDIRRLFVSKKGGDFSSIKTALDSILDSSESIRYVVEVGPGEFVEDEMTIPNYVSVHGSAIQTTIIKPSNTLQNLFIMGTETEISFFTMVGLNGTGKAAVKIQNVGDFAQLHKISIYDFDIGIEHNSTTSDSNLYIEYVDINGDYTNAIKAASSNGFLNRTQAENFYAFESLNLDAETIYGTGTNLELQFFVTKLFCESTQKGIVVNNGTSLRLNAAEISGASVGVEVENLGTGSKIVTLATSIANNTINYLLSHPSTTGSIFGGVDLSKVQIDPAAQVSVLFLDVVNSGIALNGPFFYSNNSYENLTEISQLIVNAPPMGVMDGGELSVDAGLSLAVAEGFGYYMTSNIPSDILVKKEWENSTILLPSQSTLYVYFNNSGILTSNTTEPDPEKNIILGRVITNSTGISYIEKTPFKIHHLPMLLSKTLRHAFGPVYVEGNLVTETGTRQLHVTSGHYHFAEHKFGPVGGNPITFDTLYKSSTAGQWVKTTGVTTVSNSQYDNLSGTLVTIPAGKFAKHLLVVLGGPSEQWILIYAQDIYDTAQEAIDAGLPAIPEWMGVYSSFAKVAGIIVGSSETNLNTITDERPKASFSASSIAGGGAGITNHGALSGLGDDDHTQYLLSAGTRAMSGSLDMGGNSITNVNLVDGVDVSAHASRHLPNGVDPLSTGIPSSTGSQNQIGIANAFARQDHIHNTVIANQEASATANTTTTSTTDVTLNSMSITAGVAGTYLVNCSTSVTHGTNGAVTTLSIYANGVQNASSSRAVIARAGNNNFQHMLGTFAIVTVTAGQVIDARWRTSAGTATAQVRSINILRIG
jgi:pectin methylesterase-like acyl-CoA thioesterase